MTGWIRLENTAPENLKVAPISDKAFRLWVSAICYCSRAKSSGRVPAALIRSLSPSATKATVAELLEVGLVERLDERTYLVHDYLDYNPSRERIDEMREGSRERVAAWRERQAGNGVTDHDVTALLPHNPRARDRSVSVKSCPAVQNNTDLEVGSKRREPSRRADQNEPPVALPSELHSVARSVLGVLAAVQAERGGDEPTIRGVGLAMLRHGNRDFMAVARELEHWATAGRGARKPVKDWARTFATFLGNVPEGAAPKLRVVGSHLPEGQRPTVEHQEQVAAFAAARAADIDEDELAAFRAAMKGEPA